jgi:transcription-repair coupling factor (superfamily II helicase)
MVGYELYCQLLEAAVRRLRNLPPKLEVDVTMELPGEALLPREYVPDLRAKIDLYRRLARIFDEEGLVAIQEELVDRFGPLPKPVERLLALARLKNDMARWQLNSLHLEKPYLAFGFSDRQRAQQLVRNSGEMLRRVDDASLYGTLPHRKMDADAIIAFARSLLQP